MPNVRIKQFAFGSIFSVLILGLMSSLFSLYDGFFDLYIFNKAVAVTAFILLGFVLLTGPLGRMYNRFDWWLQYRKAVGMISFCWAYVHGVISLSALEAQFSAAYYQSHVLPFLAATFGLFILTVLFVISFDLVISDMNKKVWWHMQYWGVRIATLVLFIHAVQPKWSKWISWFAGSDRSSVFPWMPPVNLLVSLFLLFVFSVRILERLMPKQANKAVLIVFILYVLSYVGLVGWGIFL